MKSLAQKEKELYEKLVVDLFKLVGLDYTFEQCAAWICKKKHAGKEWTWEYALSPEQSDKWLEHVRSEMNKVYKGYSEKFISMKSDFFYLGHSWRVDYADKK